MSEFDVAVVRARCEAATPGPWQWVTTEDDGLLVDAVFENSRRLWDSLSLRTVERFPTRWVGPLPKFVLSSVQDPDGEDPGADLWFIAHARTDLPAALDEIDRLTAEIATLRGEA